MELKRGEGSEDGGTNLRQNITRGKEGGLGGNEKESNDLYNQNCSM